MGSLVMAVESWRGVCIPRFILDYLLFSFWWQAKWNRHLDEALVVRELTLSGGARRLGCE